MTTKSKHGIKIIVTRIGPGVRWLRPHPGIYGYRSNQSLAWCWFRSNIPGPRRSGTVPQPLQWLRKQSTRLPSPRDMPSLETLTCSKVQVLPLPVPSAHAPVTPSQVRQDVTSVALLPWKVTSTRMRETRKVLIRVCCHEAIFSKTLAWVFLLLFYVQKWHKKN